MRSRDLTVAVVWSIAVTPISVWGFSSGASEIRECVFACDFQEVDIIKESFVVYDRDGLRPASFMRSLGFAEGVPWVVNLRDSYESDNFYAGSTSCYDPPGQADDWLVTRAVEVPVSGYVLCWKSQAYDPQRRDGLQVFISTAGNRPENFTDLPVFEVEEEESGTTENAEGEWVAHEIKLDAYAGKTIYIAFVNRSTDKSIILLDDISVNYRGKYAIENTTPLITTPEAEVSVTGTLKATGDERIDAYRICYEGADGIIHTRLYEQLNLGPGEVHDFIFVEKMKLEPGRENPYRLWAEVGNEPSVAMDGKVLCLSFIPERKVVLEEGTGEWCGNCPLGILAIENLERRYPGRFIPVAIHNGDSYAMNSYLSALGIVAFPTGRVNRIYEGSPMTRDFEFTGENTFQTLVEKALNEFTPAEVRVTGGYTGENNQRIALRTEITFAADRQATDYRILYVVREDDLPGWQYNYFSSVVHPNLGEWGKDGKYGTSRVNVLFRDVARSCIGDYTGLSGLIPDTVSAGVPIAVPAEFEVSGIISDPDKVSVVSMLIDGATGEIVNADVINLKREASVKPVTDKKIRIRYGRERIVVESTVAANISVRLYSPDGKLIAGKDGVGAAVPIVLPVHGYRGAAILQLLTADEVTVKKIVWP